MEIQDIYLKGSRGLFHQTLSQEAQTGHQLHYQKGMVLG